MTIDKQIFLLADKTLNDPEILTCVAVLIYATYTVTNRLRLEGPLDMIDSIEALKQGCRNAVTGHSASSKVMMERFHTGRDSGDITRRRKAT